MVSDSSSPPAPPGPLAAWISAARPATLWAAVAPVAVGTACAYATGGLVLWVAAVALAGALLLQIGTNFVNDLADFQKGADTEERIGPARAVQSGWLDPRNVRNAAVLTFGLSMAVGAILVARVHPWFLLLWIAGILAGIFYTAGRRPLGYLGLGDALVFFFFGPVAVVGTAWAQTGSPSELAWLASLPMGALATAILVVNNLRDRRTDAKVGKNTLAVRFGERFARSEYVFLLVLAFATVAWIAYRRDTLAPMLAWLAMPLAGGPLRLMMRRDGPALNPALGGTARLLLAYALLLSLGLVLGS